MSKTESTGKRTLVGAILIGAAVLNVPFTLWWYHSYWSHFDVTGNYGAALMIWAIILTVALAVTGGVKLNDDNY